MKQYFIMVDTKYEILGQLRAVNKERAETKYKSITGKIAKALTPFEFQQTLQHQEENNDN
jgi:hypothetical protein